jgi:uncharacterized tellurite resistance protein B-like protein
MGYLHQMFADFLRRLTAPAPSRLPDPEARLALAALLVRVARSDGHYQASEQARIDRLLQTRYHLTEAGAHDLRADAEQLEVEAPDTVRFTRAIKDAVPYEDRELVIEALWQVALADGRRDSDEDATLRLVANLLGVTDQSSALARQKVEARRHL